MKTAFKVYAGRQDYQIWSQSIREMQLVPDDEFDIPRIYIEEYGEYDEENNLYSHDARTEDNFNYVMLQLIPITRFDSNTSACARTVEGIHMRL